LDQFSQIISLEKFGLMFDKEIFVMGSRSDCFCWEIMQCDKSKNCPARQNPEKPCWEIASEDDYDYRNFFNICRDCIVRMLKVENSVLSNLEIQKIVDSKTKCRLSSKQACHPPPDKNVSHLPSLLI
jgi:hypothetical protein